MGSTFAHHLVLVHAVCDVQYELRHFMAGWSVPMCNHLAVTFRICLYAHCKIFPYDTSCEGREMVYFHTQCFLLQYNKMMLWPVTTLVHVSHVNVGIWTASVSHHLVLRLW